jgi:hypothetical protein
LEELQQINRRCATRRIRGIASNYEVLPKSCSKFINLQTLVFKPVASNKPETCAPALSWRHSELCSVPIAVKVEQELLLAPDTKEQGERPLLQCRSNGLGRNSSHDASLRVKAMRTREQAANQSMVLSPLATTYTLALDSRIDHLRA